MNKTSKSLCDGPSLPLDNIEPREHEDWSLAILSIDDGTLMDDEVDCIECDNMNDSYVLQKYRLPIIRQTTYTSLMCNEYE